MKIEASEKARTWSAKMRENVAERFSRELRVDRIWEGISQIQRVIIADSLLKRGLDAM
jgi:acyl-CoA dehydrogenase